MLVYICSAYSADPEGNTARARQYCRMAAERGAVPLAPHLLFPQFMSEDTERELALQFDMELLTRCDEIWVFGRISPGMRQEINYAEEILIPIKWFDRKGAFMYDLTREEAAERDGVPTYTIEVEGGHSTLEVEAGTTGYGKQSRSYLRLQGDDLQIEAGGNEVEIITEGADSLGNLTEALQYALMTLQEGL